MMTPPGPVDGGTCPATVAQYCGDAGTCERTWATVLKQCTGNSQLYACGGVDRAMYGTQNNYYDHATGALVAITSTTGGQCIAGPADYQSPSCTASRETPIACPGQQGCDGVCCPGDVSTFTPTWKPPTGFNQGACRYAQSNALVDCLNNLPDAATCKTFFADPVNKTCLACVITPATAAAYGPLVEGTVTIEVNVAGCIAQASGDTSATGCGAKVLAVGQCEEGACAGANCFAADPFAALLACKAASDKDPKLCKSYVDAAACADLLTGDAGVAAACVLTGTTFADNAKAMVKLFCGGTLGDGGISDAGDGG